VRLPIDRCSSRCVARRIKLKERLFLAATTEDCEKLRFDFLRHVSSTRGRFACEEERVWPCTIGLNEKGGMNDEEEFEKYIDYSIVPLYLDLEDTPGKRSPEVDEVGAVYLWIDLLRQGLSDIKSRV
jgi:hypothetical protein